jgi:hypothetical protein
LHSVKKTLDPMRPADILFSDHAGTAIARLGELESAKVGPKSPNMHSDSVSSDLLTMAQVAEILHCSKAHVCNAVAGRVRGCQPIPALRLGRRKLVRRETLLQWIERNEQPNAMIRESPERGARKHA